MNLRLSEEAALLLRERGGVAAWRRCRNVSSCSSLSPSRFSSSSSRSREGRGSSTPLDVNGETVEVDGRPSDGLILAAITGAEIRVAEDVLAEVADTHGRTLPSVETLEAEATARTPEIVGERLALIERATRSAC